MMFKDKIINKYLLYTIFLIILISISMILFKDYQYKNVTVNNKEELQTQYSNLKIDSETNDFVNITAESKNGEKVKFMLEKKSELYKEAYILSNNNSSFLNQNNIMKLLVLLVVLIGGSFIFLKDVLFKNKKSVKITLNNEQEKQKSGRGSVTKSENFEITHSNVTFNDIAGCDYVKQELQEIVDQLRNPEKYKKLGANLIKGAALYGPPGTGKTFFAKAVAGEVNVPFISVNGSDFVDEYVGRGPNRVRELFSLAKQNAPCVIFIDEIDALGSERSGNSNNKEYDNTVNALLVELQGFSSNEHIVVLCATNKLENLDQALVRPGRLDRKIEIGLPDKEGRLKIITHLSQLNNRKFSKDCDFENLANLTYNFSAAELDALINEAILLAARKNEEDVNNARLYEAFDKVSLGIKSNKNLNKKEKEIVAYHEAGHAVMTKHLKPNDIIQKITILPQGSSLGYVQKTPKYENLLQSKDDLINEIFILLAGRVAEDVFFNSITNGAENDLKVATNILNHMRFKFGMFEQLAYQENTTNNDCINKYLTEYYEEVKKLITNELHSKVEGVAKALLSKEVMTGKELDKIYKKDFDKAVAG